MAKKTGTNFSDRARIAKFAAADYSIEETSDILQVEVATLKNFWPDVEPEEIKAQAPTEDTLKERKEKKAS